MTLRIGDPVSLFGREVPATSVLLTILAETTHEPARSSATLHGFVPDLDPAGVDWHAENCDPEWCEIAATVREELAELARIHEENPLTYDPGHDRLHRVHPHPAAATAQLVNAYLRGNESLNARHINEVLVTHGPEFVVATLVGQLVQAIASPQFDVKEWVAVEIDRSDDAMQMEAELHIIQQNEEMKALGIPSQYRDRLRAWANGATVEEIVERIGQTWQDVKTELRRDLRAEYAADTGRTYDQAHTQEFLEWVQKDAGRVSALDRMLSVVQTPDGGPWSTAEVLRRTSSKTA